MNREEFLKKYPELDDDGQISKHKISLLQEYSQMKEFINKDDKTAIMMKDYNSIIICENRVFKIDKIIE